MVHARKGREQCGTWSVARDNTRRAMGTCAGGSASQCDAQQPLAYDVSCKSSSSRGARPTARITDPGPRVCTALSPGETNEAGVTVIFSGGDGSVAE